MQVKRADHVDQHTVCITDMACDTCTCHCSDDRFEAVTVKIQRCCTFDYCRPVCYRTWIALTERHEDSSIGGLHNSLHWPQACAQGWQSFQQVPVFLHTRSMHEVKIECVPCIIPR